MHTFPSGRNEQARSQRESGPREGRGYVSDNAEDEYERAMLRLSQDQMLVNQALVEKIFACERTETALRASEQQLHELLAHQLVTREEERKRISRELHDSLAQNLLALRIDIVLLHRHTTERHAHLRDRIGCALDNVDITLRTVKALLGELRPSAMELGLLATVDAELRKFTRASGIACELAAGPAVDGLIMAEEEVLTIYRAVQECLNNVFRHSLASRVKVSLDVGAHLLAMRIVDNGIGFDPAAPRKSSSFGLLDLRERVALHGGELVLKAAHAHGTEVTVRLPIGSASCGLRSTCAGE